MALQRCPRCGTPVDADGLCPACLLRVGLSDLIDSIETATSGRHLHFAPTVPAPHTGDEFGEYRLIRLLGHGGFGIVWEAEHRETHRRVALKVITEVTAASPEALGRFEREGQLAASVSDPHCVFVYAAEVIAGYPAIVMELMPGGTLQDRLDNEGPLPAKEAVDCILEAVDGLEAAQRAGVIHRDIKPSNCFVDETGAVKIGDFGVSTTLEGSQLTRTGSFLGTPSYASPEQARGRDVDCRSDIYSLGATLYALLTGRPPFTGAHPGEVLARVLSEEPSPMARDALEFPRGLERIVRRMLAKDPVERYQNYKSLRAALLPFSSFALTPATLAQRFCAYLVDVLLIGLTLDWLGGLLVSHVLPLGYPDLLDPLLTPTFYYFLIAEWRWGRSIGKRLFGLRVTTAVGTPPSLAQVILRTSVFWFVPTVSAVARQWFVAGGSSGLVGFVASFLEDAIVLLTMNATNGYAGMHELISRTRVMATRDATIATVPSFRLAGVLGPPKEPLSLGPYRVLHTLWHTPTEALILARDDVLRRTIWVHQFVNEGASAAMSAIANARKTRLRCLSGSRADAWHWDAFEAPSGTSLIKWVASQGRLPWSDARRVLGDVVLELEALQAEGNARFVLALNRVWVDARGAAKLLDFPGSDGGPQEGDLETLRIDQWRVFLHSFLALALEGRMLSDPWLQTWRVQVPIPEHARPLLDQICNRGFESIADLLGVVRSIAERPALVTPSRRLGSLMAATIAGAAAMILALWIWKMPQPGDRTYMNVGVLLAGGVPMVALAFALRGSVWLRLFGIAVQSRDGQPAGRIRCALRAAVIWLPLLPILRVLAIEIAPGNLTFGYYPPPGDRVITTLFIAAPIFLVGSAVYALVRPDRGIPDLVSGTRLMPM